MWRCLLSRCIHSLKLSACFPSAVIGDCLVQRQQNHPINTHALKHTCKLVVSEYICIIYIFYIYNHII